MTNILHTLQKTLILNRSLARINVYFDWQQGWCCFLQRQLAAIGIALLGFFLALPGVPGPGWAFLLFSMLIGSYPGKMCFVRWIRKKRIFRVTRVLLRHKLRVLLVLPQPAQVAVAGSNIAPLPPHFWRPRVRRTLQTYS